MKKHTGNKELNRIEKRAIEALAIAPIIKSVAQRIGWDEALAVLQEANQQEAFQRGRNMAEEMRRNGIEELIDDVAGWGKAVYWKWMSWNKLQRPIFSMLPVALIMMSTKSWDWRSSVLNFHAVVTNPLQGDLILNLDLSGQKPSWKALNFAIFITIWMTSEQADIGLRYLYF